MACRSLVLEPCRRDNCSAARGIEGNLAGGLTGILERPDTLALTDADIGLSASFYLLGSVIGALVFGYATDRFGRKTLFVVTLRSTPRSTSSFRVECAVASTSS